MLLDEIIVLSHKYGNDPEMVLAGGGNTSVKENGVLYVKASEARWQPPTKKALSRWTWRS